MREVDPVSRLYQDITQILHTMTIKYSCEADKYETMETRAASELYMDAILHKDVFERYQYTEADFIEAGVTDFSLRNRYMSNNRLIPKLTRGKLLAVRRERYINEYEEQNNYYRMLYGLPDLEDKDFVYLPEEFADMYKIPRDLPVHKIEDEFGKWYVDVLDGLGAIKILQEKYPDKKYLHYLGSNRIPLQQARRAKNFAILHVEQEGIMESTYREFTRSYEMARIYFVSTCYVYEYRNIIKYYDNFIALCIFLMAIQQVSMRAIKNAIDREFYDEYLVRLLYETYGLPYFSRIDETTQKQIVQNINLLVQHKATDKVMLDIASLLGFNDIKIYQYYLMRKRRFDDNGRPIFKKKTQMNPSTGVMEEVYNYESMYSVYFQKSDIREENKKNDLTDSHLRDEYYDITYYDPFWWEDTDLKKEVWETQYNFMETKYYGITVPYRLTELLFQSVMLLRIINEKAGELWDVTLQLPKITTQRVTLNEAVILYLALMAKKYKMSGQILTLPSKLIHILEVTDQEINKESDHIEVFGFDFEAFSPDNIKETLSILDKYLKRKKYRVVDGHDVDLMEDGRQDKSAPTHKIQWTVDDSDLQELYSYLTILSIPDVSPKEKVKALNKMYENLENLYWFLSYHLSATNDMEEYYAIKKFYDVAFYSRETAEFFNITDEDDNTHPAETFAEYFEYKNPELFNFIENCPEDMIYVYINHILYKIEQLNINVGSLYLLNDGFSPLMELLQILENFFKSYVIDFVKMKTLMIIDWDLENTVRLFGWPEHIFKVDQAEDKLGAEFMDLLHRYIAHFKLEDYLKLMEFIFLHGHIKLTEQLTFEEAYRLTKVDAAQSEILFFDSIPELHGKITSLEDRQSFYEFIAAHGGLLNLKLYIHLEWIIEHLKKTDVHEEKLPYYDALANLIGEVPLEDRLKMIERIVLNKATIHLDPEDKIIVDELLSFVKKEQYEEGWIWLESFCIKAKIPREDIIPLKEYWFTFTGKVYVKDEVLLYTLWDTCRGYYRERVKEYMFLWDTATGTHVTYYQNERCVLKDTCEKVDREE